MKVIIVISDHGTDTTMRAGCSHAITPLHTFSDLLLLILAFPCPRTIRKFCPTAHYYISGHRLNHAAIIVVSFQTNKLSNWRSPSS